MSVKKMAVDIHKLIAAINPDLYCKTDKDPEKNARAKVKKIVKEELAKENKRAYLEAAEKAEPVESSFYDFDKLNYKDAFEKEGLKNPIEKHRIEYDAFGESLEPVYFWLFDYMESAYGKIEKLIDNFVASPGSSYHAEMGAKATRMQEEAMKILGAANTVLRSVLNLIYDLKEMNLVLDSYDRYNSSNKDEKESGLLSLKQKWMDAVDIKRGTSSLKGFAQQFDYVTLIDAFMAVNSLEDVKKLDLNERVKRILEQRIPEFLKWVSESEKELRKRYEIEKTYLKSQVNSLKLYARWAKPYLKAAKALEQRASPTAALVSSFNTVLLELMLVGMAKYEPEDDVLLPKKLFENATSRKYFPVVVLDFKFRSMPERAGQSGYGFRGKVVVEFVSYCLNNEEVEILKEQLERDELDDIFGAIEGATDESLAQIQTDIDELLGEKKEEEEKEEEKTDVNPFEALFGFLIPEKKKEKSDLSKGIKSDSELEKVIRSQAILTARKKCDDFYITYKKTHGMAFIPT